MTFVTVERLSDFRENHRKADFALLGRACFTIEL
jgi:hypothetical protein